jgi:hypothetical protein
MIEFGFKMIGYSSNPCVKIVLSHGKPIFSGYSLIASKLIAIIVGGLFVCE